MSEIPKGARVRVTFEGEYQEGEPVMATDVERFWGNVDKGGPIVDRMLGPCWLWTGGVTGSGYGGFYVTDPSRPRKRRQVGVHKWSYERVHGQVAADLEVDHLCFNVLCVKPDHLEAVTPAENGRRSGNWCGVNSRKTHCPKGHPYSAENTRINNRGGRECKECKRAKDSQRVRPPTERGRAQARERQRRYRRRKALESAGEAQ